MSLLKKSKSKKLQSLVLASVLALTVGTSCNPANAAIGSSTINLNNSFIIQTSSGNNSSYSTSGTINRGYIVYSPTDRNIVNSRGETIGHLQGGKLYFVRNTDDYTHDADSSSDPLRFEFDSSGNLVDESGGLRGHNSNYYVLGNAQDIFGEGITEDEIKDLISNVQGDQTVNGSQDITGDQTVEGEQTVKSVA